ncbi:MAG: hypothetical protein LLF94_12515 [Chlamydiales bacterium]|nr:hypothetical protein [Chlamydiales bacterium]
MNEITRLLFSWDTAAKKAGLEDAPATSQSVIKSLYITSVNHQLSFVERPQKKNFFAHLFEQKNESFPVKIAKLQNILLLAQSGPLSDTQRAQCETLEERINAMGRYVFAKRASKSLFAPKLGAYQIRLFTLTNQLIAPDECKRDLPNPGNTLCWLNASIKFMAACVSYDAHFTTKGSTAEQEELRKCLFHLIEALRKNWDQRLVNALYNELVVVLQKGAFADFFGDIQDADEFIVRLGQYLPAQDRPTITMAKLYKSFDDTVWKPGRVDIVPKLEISPNQEAAFSLEEAFRAEDLVENVNYYFVGNEEIDYVDPKNFTEYHVLLSTPTHLEIMIKRGISYDRALKAGSVSRSKVILSDSGTLTLKQYSKITKIIGGKEYIVGAKEEKPQRFRAVAAIERITPPNSRDGHFITHTRAKNGQISTHKDSKVISNLTEAVWENAYYLMLEKTN